VVAQRKGQQPESPQQWLEEELREAKARLHKVEHELEQALKQVWALDADVRQLSEALSAAGAEAAALPGLREELRQLRDQASRVQDRQTALTNRTEELLRQHSAEAGRERQERAALAKQVDALAKGIGQYEGRIQALEEASRHVEEEVAGGRLAQQGLARDLEDVSSRTARNLEAATRLERELGRATEQLEALRKEDEALSDRLNLIHEQVRRHGERLDKFEDIAAFPAEAKELLQRARFEREQLAERLGAVERLSTEVEERVQEFVQGLARLDQKGQSQATQLLLLQEQIHELNEQTKEQMKRLFQNILRQRRRQAEALAQEIKELSQGELSSGK
jgi:chromosome segregation ATPase